MSDSLRDYTKVKLDVADQLRITCEAMSALSLEESADEINNLITKLAEDRFILAVLGQFKRGKSSLMNAIIGRQLLPVGVLPLTSVITTLKYGPNEKLLIKRKRSSFTETHPVSELSVYVTETGNPGNSMGIETAHVELPVLFLRRGLEFVDTPGIGSAITENTEQTYVFLPKCDAAIFVTATDTPLTSLELAFLNEIREYTRKIFFIVNKIDLVTDVECDEIIDFVVNNIKKQTGQEEIKLFPVSSRMGLEARLSGDGILYEKSGIKELEDALAVFLSEEKAELLLATVLKKAMNVINGEAERGAFNEDALSAWAMRMEQQDYVRLKREPHDSAAAISRAFEKLKSIRHNILAGSINESYKAENISLVKQGFHIKNDNTGILEDNKIIADLQTRTCPVCKYLTNYSINFFAHFQYLIASNEDAQTEFANGFGFCPLHTWQLLSMCSPHGASIGFAKLSEQVASRLRSIDAEEICGLIVSSKSCQVCEELHKEENTYTKRLAELLKESVYRKLYDKAQGVCLRHLEMLLTIITDRGLKDNLISHSAIHFEEDAEDMRSFALKIDARRRNLQNTSEEDAYRRAIIRLVGGRDICTPWAEDGEI